MCGRYGSWTPGADLAIWYSAALTPEAQAIPASWNHAPGADIRVLIERLEAQPAPSSSQTPKQGTVPRPIIDPDGDAAVARELRTARWGLLPPWAKEPAEGFRAFNARRETVANKPTFRTALRSFRCILPADCWYEWPQAPTVSSKQPYAVRSADGSPLALAGLCSWWRLPEAPTPDGSRPVRPGPALHGNWLLTATILTRPAAPDLAWLHEREPVTLHKSAALRWIDPRITNPAHALAILDGSRAELTCHPVGPEVGNSRVDHPGLVLPCPELAIPEPTELEFINPQPTSPAPQLRHERPPA
ncbi:Uncharacterised ACR, COG2135 [Actinomyces bovis]|uniref:Abasic site processing protein n=1 Tax=Actinomyces bovis TaxID=1658 RepID=A0ABY1VLU3_9ACTO|nr:SOS response-associated peptidase [Actinomyces bovis]SPT53050.1 Uncharacterised ACR, COG2135 [Actinomyces bovis]VEG53023.1 Uncharacterised ACR, COG2135 [Actinomyces israelii]